MPVRRKPDTGRNPCVRALRAAERVAARHPEVQRTHPSALPADPARLGHVHVHVHVRGALPGFCIDRPYVCRGRGKWGIRRAAEQTWHFEEARGTVDATAVRCRDCRRRRRAGVSR